MSLEERRYENGADPEVLDIVTIQMIGPAAKLHQTENHLLNDQFYWVRNGALGLSDLHLLAESPATLWANGHSSSNGFNDYVLPAENIEH